jgi:hypothetical protein
MQMKRFRTRRTTRQFEVLEAVAGVTLEAVILAVLAGWAYRWDEAVWEELAGWIEEGGAEVRVACRKAGVLTAKTSRSWPRIPRH